MTPPSGSIFFRDEYGVLYWTQWDTTQVDGVDIVDFTTITKSPHVWGEPDQGYVKDRQVYSRGICTTERQIIEPTELGYSIIAEGSSQSICFFQITFNCGGGPTDTFKYHMDNAVSGEEIALMVTGPRFADPTELDDIALAFSPVLPDGTVVPGIDPFGFVSVW